MNALVMSRVCQSCSWHRALRYADGHNSIQCTHPVNATSTTRDITILPNCPEGKEPETLTRRDMNGEIVTYNGEPALVLGENASGKGIILRFRGKVLRVVLKTDVKPYSGDKDAVALGLKEPDAQ